MDYDKIKMGLKDLSSVLLLVVLVVVLILILSMTGIVKCSKLPYACQLQEFALGKPKVLIVTGNDGLGEPEKLQKLLADPNHLNILAQVRNLNYISYGNIEQFDLIIVEKAATMSTEQLKTFTDYATKKPNGHLIWVGDSGSKLPANEMLKQGDYLLYENERRGVYVEESQKKFIGPWSRKDTENNIINFDQIISAQFLANFCDVKTCGTENPFIGNLRPEKDSSLVFGLASNLPLKGNFSLIKEINTGANIRVLSVDYMTNINTVETGDLGSVLPIIIQSGIGGRIAYYAIPPESLVQEGTEQKYYSVIENMYLGILGYI